MSQTLILFLPRLEVSGREFMYPFQHQKVKFNSCSAENCERKSKFSEILVRGAETIVEFFSQVVPKGMARVWLGLD